MEEGRRVEKITVGTGIDVSTHNGAVDWDTHGLPVELGVEKKLGITKEDIGSKISVEEYNATCRSEVMKYTAEWRNLTERIGYWVDMDDPYITYDNLPHQTPARKSADRRWSADHTEYPSLPW